MAKISGQRMIYEMINNRITSLLEKGDIPWRKPLVSGEPVNFITKKPYRDISMTDRYSHLTANHKLLHQEQLAAHYINGVK